MAETAGKNRWWTKGNLLIAVNATVFLAVLCQVTTVLAMGSGADALGISRHDWRELHQGVGVVLLCAIGLHVFLNGRWIVGTVKSFRAKRPE